MRRRSPRPLDGLHLRLHLHLHTGLAPGLHQQVHEVGIEPTEGPGHHLEDPHPPARPSRHVRELEGDEPPAEEEDFLRERVELQELVAGSKMLLAGEAELHRLGARGDQHVVGRERLAVDLEGRGRHEPRPAVIRVDPGLAEGGLPALRHRAREAPLERHEVGPADPDAVLDPVSPHPPAPVDGLGRADQHLLRIAPPQGACTPERARVDDRHPPAGGAAAAGHGGTRRPRPDHDQVERARHRSSRSTGCPPRLVSSASAAPASGSGTAATRDDALRFRVEGRPAKPRARADGVWGGGGSGARA